MVTKTGIESRLAYVRKHITEKAKNLAKILDVDIATIYRYKRHITLGVPVSGTWAARSTSQGKKLVAAREETIPQKLNSIEDKVDTLSEKVDKVLGKKKRHFFWSD
jgi:hypothetical protein